MTVVNKLPYVAALLFSLISGCLCSSDIPSDLLVIEPHAGFGNRIRAVSSAAAIASLTGRRLVINWQLEIKPEHSEMVATFAQLFTNSELTPGGANISNDEIECLAAREQTRVTYNAETKNFVVPRSESTEYIRTFENFGLAGGNLGQEKKLKAKFVHSLNPIAAIAEPVARFRETNWPKTNGHPDNDKIMGIHYRAGGQAGDFGIDFNNPSIDELVKIMQAAKLNWKVEVFFIASNDVSVIKQIEAHFSKREVLSYQPVQSGRDTVVGQQQAIIEWYLLGNTKIIYGTKASSFSDTAALLTSTIEKRDFGSGMIWPDGRQH